ncbi:uncharacterized protein LOC127964133 [Carassius gibelio]|uniref:uncharacterized protein LOC127964133 n=1 Tax=Carassius gibelio TaxID=101364 RepID=UPI0022797223|nr:uncharacterized protein LOC127964133 [Carassius gibelio]
MSVLTANEGAGLDLMAAGLMERYRSAGVDPPTIIYVDCDCCKKVGETKLKRRFSGWPDVIVRLDIWHFMRRLAVGCTTDAHQLYPTFMARLSSCIFEWDAGDLTLLRQAKREQLIQQGWPTLSEEELDHHLTKAELLQHCRRRTRGEETTFRLLDMLIRELMGGKGNDALGVPLLDSVRMQHIWNVQRRHITCIQDPPNVPLYTETGTTSKGGVVLKTYRCARGSTSLESFHCHLSRFIPGNSANSLNFQIYLLEGLLRWNQDRAEAAVADGGSTLRSYTGELVYSVNENYNKLYGRKLVPSFTPPAVYTGELIGVQYLLRQNSQPLEDMCPTSDRTSQLLEEIDVEEQVEKDEGFIDFFGEEATVANLVASDDLVLSGPPVLPAAPVPTAPVPSVQDPLDTPVPSAMAVDEHCIPGMDRVDALAECLVELRTQTSLTLTNQQVATIVGLWQNLDKFDKDRLILSNGTVMSDTTLQLVEVNQRTLTTWHNNRLKGQEVSLLLQGLDLPEARPVALDVLPPARVQPVVPPQYSHQLHTYQMPPDTAGQAKTNNFNLAISRTPSAFSHVQPAKDNLSQADSTTPFGS